MATTVDAPGGARDDTSGTSSHKRPTAGAPLDYLSARARLGAALLGIAIGLLAAAACGVLGVLLAQAFFGTTGGIL